jgi:hypothetical protein
MAPKKTTLIRGVLRTVNSSRVQYKPYSYELDFSGALERPAVLVELEIPTDTIVDSNNQEVVVNLNGFTVILEQLADALDLLNIRYQKKYGG